MPDAVFSAADLARAPNVLSLLRIPLAVAFPFVASRPPLALAVLAAAGLTDVLDGWIARRTGAVTALGAVVDPLADKVFAITVVSSLVIDGRLPLWGVPALLAREILEAPLLGWVLWQRHRRGRPARDTSANVPGKVATVAQFAAVLVALAAPGFLTVALAVAATAGGAAGIVYWTRELREIR